MLQNSWKWLILLVVCSRCVDNTIPINPKANELWQKGQSLFSQNMYQQS